MSSRTFFILGDVRRVARLIESHRAIKISRVTRFIPHLHDTMMILSGRASARYPHRMERQLDRYEESFHILNVQNSIRSN